LRQLNENRKIKERYLRSKCEGAIIKLMVQAKPLLENQQMIKFNKKIKKILILRRVKILSMIKV